MHPIENPFASRFVRPGALPFFFLASDQIPGSGTRQSFGISPTHGSGARRSSGISGDADVDQLIDRLASCGWRGAIVGPHGSGKSTLLTGLSAELVRRGIDVRHFGRVGNTTRDVRPTPSAFIRNTVCFVDGFDMLSGWRRWFFRWQCRRQAWGLVVTGHPPVEPVSNLSRMLLLSIRRRRDGRVGNPSYMGLPILCNTRTTPEIAERVAAALAGGQFASAAQGHIRNSFSRHDGNLREVLFDLYDLYERQARSERIEGWMPAAHSLSPDWSPSPESATAAFSARDELGLPE